MNPNPSNWTIINTPELKALFAPTQDRDEIQFGDNQGWYPIGGQHYGCSFGSANYRRPASRAWLKISDNPVQYPAWVRREDGTVRWFETDPINPIMKAAWLSWLPAPPAPEGPRDEDDEAFMEFLRSQGRYGGILTAALAKQFWQAGREYEMARHHLTT